MQWDLSVLQAKSQRDASRCKVRLLPGCLAQLGPQADLQHLFRQLHMAEGQRAALGPWVETLATPLKFRHSTLLFPITFFFAGPCSPPGDYGGHHP